MKTYLLKNEIQEYIWGSKTAIPELLGVSPSGNPCAEIWMGSHPKAPSKILVDGELIRLDEAIKKNPSDMLGSESAKKYGNQLPFLFKVLAVAHPLSLQAHPNREQAHAGFNRESLLPIDDPSRNYRDKNHKPELICALTPFSVLCGFRPMTEITEMIPKNFPISPKGVQIRHFFQNLMLMPPNIKSHAIESAVRAAKDQKNSPVWEWVIRLYNEYPQDIGVLSPIFLNFTVLEPGQALYLPAGEIHTYLDGTCIELMANSDNVIRGGLTSKHVDITELMRILTFKDKKINIIMPELNGIEAVYLTTAEEFVLSVIRLRQGYIYRHQTKSAEILFCTQGHGKILEHNTLLKQGVSVFIPASCGSYQIEGDAVIYRAAVRSN